MVEKRISESKENTKKTLPPAKKCYTNIGEPLPSNVTLADITNSLPSDVFEKTYFKGGLAVLRTIFCVAAAFYSISISHWSLLPIAWIFCGTAMAGVFMILHDCGHRSLFPSLWANEIFGELSGMFLLYPFHAWRIQHNHHHNHTNKLHVDNTWHPTNPEKFVKWRLVYRFTLRVIKEYFLWNLGSIAHELNYHFRLSLFSEENKPCVRRSISLVVGFGLVLIPSLIYFTGFWGFSKFYLVPWFVYHFWLSTFTLVHHTLPHIPFKPESEWTLVDRFASTVHCQYPFWVEWICHDINVHIPHHTNTNIPSYNLRRAHNALKQKWGKHMHEVVFGWELMLDIISKCHMYHKDKNYQSYDEFWQNRNEVSHNNKQA